MKRVVKTIIVAGMFVSSIVLADGFYLGGQMGLEKTSLDRTFMDINAKTSSTDDLNSTNQKSKKTSFNGGIYGGYKMELQDKMTIAVELDGFLGSQKYEEKMKESNGDSPILKDKTGYMIGLSVLGGYVLENNLEVYGRLGIAHTSIQFQSLTDNNIALPIKKKSVDLIGLVIGFGVQTSLGRFHESLENLSARFDYRYIMHPKKDLKFAEDGVKIEYKLNKHVVMLGVDYRF